MRQIDLMVTAKKAEWENHMHAVQIQLDKKTKETDFVKGQLELKSQEVCTSLHVHVRVVGVYLQLYNHEHYKNYDEIKFKKKNRSTSC